MLPGEWLLACLNFSLVSGTLLDAFVSDLYTLGFVFRNVYTYFKRHAISLLPRLSLYVYTFLER